MHNEHIELRSEVENQAEQAKTGKHELKSQIYIKMWPCRTGQYVCRTAQLCRSEENVVTLVPDVTRVVPDGTCVVPDSTTLQKLKT